MKQESIKAHLQYLETRLSLHSPPPTPTPATYTFYTVRHYAKTVTSTTKVTYDHGFDFVLGIENIIVTIILSVSYF